MMAFPTMAVVLILLKAVASIATVDPNSLALNDLAPNPSLNDAFDDPVTKDANSSPLLALLLPDAKPLPSDAIIKPAVLAADATTFPDDTLANDVPASVIAAGTADEAGLSDPGNNPAPDSADAECITDTQNARKRARRGCVTIPVPNTQQSTPQVENVRKKPNKKKKKKESQIGKPLPREPPLKSPDNLPNYKPDLWYKTPKPVGWLCDPLHYPDMSIPMCSEGDPDQDDDLIYWHRLGTFDWAVLFHAHPWVAGFACMDLEYIWCCNSVTVNTPTLALMHDLSLVDYTGFKCVPF